MSVQGYTLRGKKKDREMRWRSGGEHIQGRTSSSQAHLCNKYSTLLSLRNRISEQSTGGKKGEDLSVGAFPSPIIHQNPLNRVLTPLCHPDPPGVHRDSQNRWRVWGTAQLLVSIPRSGPNGQLLGLRPSDSSQLRPSVRTAVRERTPPQPGSHPLPRVACIQ